MGRSGYRTVSGIVFGLIALGHGIRAVMQLPAQLGATSIPIWVSWLAVAVAGGLCLWAFRFSAEHQRAA
jgi:hypothetical protein